MFNIGNKRNYQNIILHIVLQLTANGRHGPIGVPAVLHAAWVFRQGGVTQKHKHKQTTDNATFDHVLVCFIYPYMMQKVYPSLNN